MNVVQIREALKAASIGVDGNKELIGASFIADEPSIFGKPNKEYISAEIEWYLSQSLCVHDMNCKVPKIWEEVSSNRGMINSNYGWCIFSSENGQQWINVMKHLAEDRESRRAVFIYTRPSMHRDYKIDGMQDFMCTNTVQVLIRDNKLDLVVQMRSNDAVFGYKNDFAWQKYVQKLACRTLKVEEGDIHWQVGSLHVYPRHFGLLE